MLLRDELAPLWSGGSYHPLHNNCIHFCEVVLEVLGVNSVPGWVRGLHETGASLSKMTARVVQALGLPGDSGHPARALLCGVTPLAVPPSMPTACRRSLASNSFDPDQDSGPDIGTYVLGDDESDTFCIDEDGCDSFASVQVDLDNLSVPCETACEACGGQPDSQGSFSVARPDSCRLRQAELEVGSDNGLLIFLGDVIDDRRDGQDGGRYLPLRHLELELFYLGDITLDNALPLGGLEAMCQQECDPEAEVVYLGVVMDDRCSKGGTDCCSRGPAKVAKCDREWDWTLGEDCSEVVFLGEDFGRRTSLTVRVNRVHLGEEDMSSCRLMLSSWEDRDVGSLPLSEAAGTDRICLGLTEKNFCVNDISDEASLLDFMQGPAARREPKILSEAVPS